MSGSGLTARRQLRGERLEEPVGHCARGRIDYTRTDLRELPADLGVPGVGQLRLVGPDGHERDACLAAREAGRAAAAFEFQRVAVRPVGIGDFDLAFKPRSHGSDRSRDRNVVASIACLRKSLGAGHAGREHGNIIEHLPRDAARGRKLVLPLQLQPTDLGGESSGRAASGGRARKPAASAAASCSRLSRLCTGMCRSTNGNIVRTPSALGSKPA